jgi:hypothetical protein
VDEDDDDNDDLDLPLHGAVNGEHSDLDDDDDDVDLKAHHRGIPTWDEAIGMIVATNMEARAKNPAGPSGSRGRRGHGRGRGGHGR